MKKVLKKIAPFISIVFFCFALWYLDQKLRQYDVAEISRQLSNIPNHYILISLVLSFLSYLVLTAYDALGVRYIGERLETGKIIRAGYVGYAFSHNMGLALITGGSIRYRIYSAWGFTGLQVTQIVAFSAFTLWIGFCSVAGLALIFATPDIPKDILSSYLSLRAVGGVLLLMLVGYVVACAKTKDKITFKKWSFRFPSLKISLQQIVIASVDWLMAASVLYVLLPSIGISFFSFVGVFLVAQIIGLFSQVPGGLGVFESIMLLYLSNFMPGSEVLGILVVYRIIYYIIPLLGALIVLGYQEYTVNRKAVKRFGEKAANWVPTVVPQVMSFSIFIGGAILLFSGALPSELPRMFWLQHFIPLPVIEMSHFLASLVGASLLILSGALQRRVDGAYHLTIGLLIFGIIFSLLKGADYEEAIVLAVMLVALIPCRKEFNRKTSLVSQQFSAQWFTMIVMVLGSAVWLGLFSYRNVEYQNSLWWQFTLMGDAPRYLRATVAALGFAFVIGLIKLLRPKKVEQSEPHEKELRIVDQILEDSTAARSKLVFLKDKQLLFDDEYTSFVMFAKESRSWITLGDPVGRDENAKEMIWKFYDVCSEEGVSPVFYDVGDRYLEHYLDLGLTQFKLGEEARVSLGDFDLTTSIDKAVYQNYKKLKKSGYEWQLIPSGETAAYMPELKAISEASIYAQDRKERGFSVGYFDSEFLSNFPIAVVKKDGNILAFSNILSGANNYELKNDLLRYRPEVTEAIIDYMLTNTMLWGKRHRYQWFNLGMAPFSGMKEDEYSDSWNRLAHFAYTYGENFYAFKAVRSYKQQFQPHWAPRYAACPGGLALPGIISNLTNVVSGGFESILNGE